MTQEINIRIELDNSITTESSQWLELLRSELQREVQVQCKSETIDAPENTQDAGLTAAIAIAGLSLSIFNTVFTVIKYYGEQMQRGSITVEGDGYSWTMKNLTDADLSAIIEEIKSKQSKNITIRLE